jgi:ubiquinone/menaquinone biosynthesis C-methylase UbiE
VATDEASAKVYTVWDQMAPGWTRDTQLLWDSSRVVGEDMVRRLDPQPGDVILELAGGTGDTGFLAAQRVGPEGKVICSDFVPAMVEGARSRAGAAGVENVEYRVLDAENIDLADDSVDGVLCRCGINM